MTKIYQDLISALNEKYGNTSEWITKYYGVTIVDNDCVYPFVRCLATDVGIDTLYHILNDDYTFIIVVEYKRSELIHSKHKLIPKEPEERDLEDAIRERYPNCFIYDDKEASKDGSTI